MIEDILVDIFISELCIIAVRVYRSKHMKLTFSKIFLVRHRLRVDAAR